jgi:ADP-ribosyl-[dinitrogen reductase] hydrolase
VCELADPRGVSGFVHHTVPVCLHAPHDFERAVRDVIFLGGDGDTTGAIVGALAGASAGEAAIPRAWLAVSDRPRSLAWIRRLGASRAVRGKPVPLWSPLAPLRNLVFLAIVLVVGLWRLAPRPGSRTFRAG